MLFPFLKFFWSQSGYLILSSLTTGMVHRQLPSCQKFCVFPLPSGCPQTFITSNTPVPLSKGSFSFLWPHSGPEGERGQTQTDSGELTYESYFSPVVHSLSAERWWRSERGPPPPKRCIFLSFPETTLIWISCWRNSNSKEELGMWG